MLNHPLNKDEWVELSNQLTWSEAKVYIYVTTSNPFTERRTHGQGGYPISVYGF